MPNRTARSLSLQLLLAFCFGVVFVTVLLVIAYFTPKPTEFQIFIYRVVMSLAAAGIGAIIPGFISVNVSGWVRAGGAIACFVLVYLVNPPTIASQQLRSQLYYDLLNRGESALASGNTTLAKHLFSAAAETAPDAYLPYVKLASAYFNSGSFESAKSNYQTAFEKSDPKDATLLYGVALSEEALDDLDSALATFKSISDQVRADGEYYGDVVFSMGQIKLKMWQKNRPNEGLYKSSLGNFKSFLELNGQPQYWAHYHLACLYATRATSISQSGSAEGEQLNDLAIQELKETVRGVKASRSQKAELHKRMLIQVLNEEIGFWPPGNPVVCAALRELSKQAFPINAAMSTSVDK